MTDLQNPELAHLQISEIAYRWGFNHPATFNRNFRAAFDITPSDARNRIHDGTATIRTLQAGTEKQRKIEAEHQQWFRAMGI
jgi:AraC-like DNA-binding protein